MTSRSQPLKNIYHSFLSLLSFQSGHFATAIVNVFAVLEVLGRRGKKSLYIDWMSKTCLFALHLLTILLHFPLSLCILCSA